MTTLNTPAGRKQGTTTLIEGLPSIPSTLVKTALTAWAVAATALTIAGLISLALHLGAPTALTSSIAGVSFGSLLAAAFLWMARNRLSARTR